MKQNLVNRMEKLLKELHHIENNLDGHFTSVDGEFHFFVKNLEVHIEKRLHGNLVSISEMRMPLSIFESLCDWYAQKQYYYRESD